MIKKECRLCKSKRLHKFLDLGNQPPSDQFINLKEIEKPTIYYPLQVYNCLKCGFKQLGFVVDPKILYQKDYPYESSLTASGNKHFNEWKKYALPSWKQYCKKNDIGIICFDKELIDKKDPKWKKII